MSAETSTALAKTGTAALSAGLMHGKTVVVTGANSGIGFVTARELAKLGATVVITCRNREKGEPAVAAIKAQSGSDDVHLVCCDMGSFASIRAAAAEIREKFPRLSVLVNNAGATIGERQLSADGIELTFAANHLGYFLLTYELLDTIKRNAPARVVNVASEAHRFALPGLNFDDLQFEKKYNAERAYGASKLCNILFTRELARRLAGSGVTANCLHPGTLATNFGKGGSRLMRFLVWIGRPFLPGPNYGARTQIFLASSPAVEGVTGEYFIRRKVARPRKYAQDDAAAKRLWEVSAKMCGL